MRSARAGDETSFRTQTRVERSFVWTFLSKLHTVYVFSSSRSGDTPKKVLGGSRGTLTIDGYTGYNIVTDGDGRERSGGMSHARRYLFDALPSAPEARERLDIILEVFLVEREVQKLNIVGTKEHLRLRYSKAASAMERLREWREKMAPLFEPKSPMGEASSIHEKSMGQIDGIPQRCPDSHSQQRVRIGIANRRSNSKKNHFSSATSKPVAAT
ncbi:IS66 family transposase [Pendulispora rubella]|uniref:IS66 family transposase n=1 Tax=Pendulispora rubella TaxID=2741070 RepID=A0ABZ2LDY1_9BACT